MHVQPEDETENVSVANQITRHFGMEGLDSVVGSSRSVENAQTFRPNLLYPLLLHVEVVAPESTSGIAWQLSFDLQPEDPESSGNVACRDERESQILAPVQITRPVGLDETENPNVCEN